jgi:uracil-DNA glycosylase
MTMLGANNRAIKASPKPPRGGEPITMDNIADLDLTPVVIDVDAIEDFLAAARNGELEGKKSCWELAHRARYGPKKRLVNFDVYRKKWTKRITYKTSLLEFALGTVPASWYEVFHTAYPALVQISAGIRNASAADRLVPDMRNIFNAFYYCPFDSIKVIILGQGPYVHLDDGVPAANGLSFSTDRGRKIENSAQNMFKELAREYADDDANPSGPFVPPNHADFRSWAKQGVLMLNATLTGVGKERHIKYDPKTRGEAHAGRWNSFIHIVMNHVTRAHKNLIIMAWGQDAQKSVQNIGMVGKHTILKCAHPSGLAGGARDPFIGCGHFVRANEILIEDEKEPINWHSVMAK